MDDNVFVVTAFGPLINTLCAAFKTEKDAFDFVVGQWKVIGIEKVNDVIEGCEASVDDIVKNYGNGGLIWKTEDSSNQNIEWEIHKTKIR